MGGMMSGSGRFGEGGGFSGSGAAAPEAGGLGGDGSTPAPEPAASPQPGGGEAGGPAAGVGFLAKVPIMGRLFHGTGTAAPGGASGSAAWVDPAAGAPAPAPVNRVLGIARIYADVANEAERADKESMLVKNLREMSEVQNLPCDVRLYPSLHVIVVKGSAEAVELVEQTIAALKENLGIGTGPRRSAAPGRQTF
jgi:hypothetical protein